MHIRSVLLILFLLAGSLSPPRVEAQPTPTSERSAGTTSCFSIEEPSPPVVTPQRTIRFVIERGCFESGKPVRVTMRIYNSLNQAVAIPSAVGHPSGNGVRVFNLEYAEPGRYEARMDGRNTAGQPLNTGVYYIQLEVDGFPTDRYTKFVIDNPRRRRFPF